MSRFDELKKKAAEQASGESGASATTEQPSRFEILKIQSAYDVNNEAAKRISEIQMKSGTEFIPADVRKQYQEAVLQYINSGETLRQMAEKGMVSGFSTDKWQRMTAELSTSVGEMEDFYSEFLDQNDYEQWSKKNARDLQLQAENTAQIRQRIEQLRRRGMPTLGGTPSSGESDSGAPLHWPSTVPGLEAYLKEVEDAQRIPNMELAATSSDDFNALSTYDPSLWTPETPGGILGFTQVTDSSPYLLYAAINGDEEARAQLILNAQEKWGSSPEGDNALGAFWGAATDSKREVLQMTDKERSVYNYYAKAYGIDKANEYYKLLESTLYARDRADMAKRIQERASKYPTEYDVASVLMSPLKGLSFMGQVLDYVDDRAIDQNAPYNQFSYIPSDIRSYRAAEIENSVEGFWGKAGSWTYQLGMSMGDFLMSTAVSGGNSTMALAIMGTGAAADTTIAAKERGLEDGKALLLGAIAGAAEVVTEKIGIDALFDVALKGKAPLVYMLKNALSEGLEEPSSTLINTIADVLISGDKSEYMQMVAQYQAQGKSPEKAFLDYLGNLGLDALGGSLSGGFMAIPGTVGQSVSYKRTGSKIIDNGGVENLTNVGSKFSGNKTIASATKRVQKKATAQNVGILYHAVAEEIQDTATSTLTDSLVESGISKRIAGKVAPIMVDSFMGIEITDTQADLLDTISRDSKIADTVAQVAAEVLTSGSVGQALYDLNSIFDADTSITEDSVTEEAVPDDSVAEETVLEETAEEEAAAEEILEETAEETAEDAPVIEETQVVEEAPDQQTIAEDTVPEEAAAEEAPEGEAFNPDELTGLDKLLWEQAGIPPMQRKTAATKQAPAEAQVEAQKEAEPSTPAKKGDIFDVLRAKRSAKKAKPTTQKKAEPEKKSPKTEKKTTVSAVPEDIRHTVENAPNMTEAGAELILGNPKAAGVEGFLSEAVRVFEGGYAGAENVTQWLNLVTPAEAKAIYLEGRRSALADAAKAQSSVNAVFEKAAAVIKESGKKVTGELRVADGVDLSKETDPGILATANLAAEIAPSLRATIVLYSGDPARAGYYKHSEDAVYVNVNARFESGESMAAFVLAHELVHRARKGSPEMYQKFSDFLVESYGKVGYSVLEMVDVVKNDYSYSGVELTNDEALEEVICQAAEKMLLDTDAGRRLAEFGKQSAENKSFVEELKQILKDIFDTLRSYFKHIEGQTEASKAFAKLDKKVQQTLADMLVDMSVDAGQKLGTIKAAGMLDEINTTGKGDVRFMSQDGIEMMSFLIPRGKKVNADLYIEDRHGLLLDDIRMHLPEIQGMSPVCNLDGTEFQKNESDTRSLKQKVKDFFDEIGNKVIRDELGVIAINNAGAQDSLEHGYGPLKAACFAALPAVIEKGSMFGPIRYLDRSYDTYLFVAPVRFVGTKNGEFYVGAYVIKDVNTTRYKIHEVLTISKEGNRPFQPEADQNGEHLRDDSLPKSNVTQPKTVVKKISSTDSDGNQLSAGQQEYFAESKAVDESENLLGLYHQTAEDITEFDPRHPGAGRSDYKTPFGIFLKRTDRDIGLQGKKQMRLYAKATNPLRAENREELVRKLREISPEYAAVCDEIAEMNRKYEKRVEDAGQRLNDYMIEWRRNNPDASRTAIYDDATYNALSDAEDALVEEWVAKDDVLSVKAKEIITEALIDAGYDSVFLTKDAGSFGRETDAIIVLNPNQVKSVDNKNPTVDDDINNRLAVTSDNSQQEAEGVLKLAQTEEEKALAEKLLLYVQRRKENKARLTEVVKKLHELERSGAAAEEIAKFDATADKIHERIATYDQEIHHLRMTEALRPLIGKYERISWIENRRSEFGTIPAGEKAVRDDSLPVSTNGQNRVSRSARTVKGAAVTPDALAEEIDEQVFQGKLAYIPIANDATAAAAAAWVERLGWSAALSNWYADVGAKKSGADIVARGAVLLNHAAQAGDKDTWLEILHYYQQLSTTTAQGLQAMRILKQLEPSDKLYMITRSVRQMVDDMNLDVDIKVDQDLLDEFRSAETDAQRDEVLDRIQQNVADQIPANFIDKFTALRYVNMLGNLRTQFRNILGNATMAGVSEIKNAVAVGLESIVAAAYKLRGEEYQRSYSMVVSKALLAQAREDYKNIEALLLAGGRYSLETADSTAFARGVNEKRRIFKTRPLEAYRKLTNKATEKGDLWFSKRAYAISLARYLKARGITDISKANPELLDNARSFAIQEAQERTFRDTNWLSGWVTKIGRRRDTPAVGKVISEGVIPFRKTPANVLMRAVEYTPLGIMGALYDSVHKGIGNTNLADKNGLAGKWARAGQQITGNQLINSWAKGLTGTSLFGLGMLLNALGVLAGGADDDEDREAFERLYGKQNYAIYLGGVNFTFDWVSPSAIPMLMGAQLMEQITDNGFQLKDIEPALTSIMDPMIEMSMMQGIKSALDNVQYAENNLGQMVITFGLSYLTQALTNSFLGQVERTFEPSRSMTYVNKESAFPGWLQRSAGSFMQKWPGLDVSQVPYINAWGEEEKNPNFVLGALQNMVSPSYFDYFKEDAVYTELMRLDEAQDDKKVLPSTPSRTYTDPEKGERQLTAEEYVQLAKIQGQLQRKLIEKLVNSASYKKMSDVDKAKCVSFVYKYAKEKAQIEVLGREAFSAKWLNEIGSGDVVKAIIAHVKSE